MYNVLHNGIFVGANAYDEYTFVPWLFRDELGGDHLVHRAREGRNLRQGRGTSGSVWMSLSAPRWAVPPT